MSFLSLAEKKERIEGFLKATNSRDVQQALTFVAEDAQLIINGKILVKGKDQIREDLTIELAKPEYSSRILNYLPTDEDDQLGFRGEMKNKEQYEETFVFSKEYPHLFSQFLICTDVDQTKDEDIKQHN